jgi:hypothetical protein
VDGINITPIAPHTLTNRPVVVPGASEIRIQPFMQVEQDEVFATFDGQSLLPLKSTHIVSVRRAEKPLRLLRGSSRGYFQVLRGKTEVGRAIENLLSHHRDTKTQRIHFWTKKKTKYSVSLCLCGEIEKRPYKLSLRPVADVVAFLDVQDEDAAVADVSRARRFHHDAHHIVCRVVSHHHFDHRLRQQADVVFPAAIHGFVPLLTPVPPHFGDGHPGQGRLVERLPDIVNFIGADDRFDQLHKLTRELRN